MKWLFWIWVAFVVYGSVQRPIMIQQRIESGDLNCATATHPVDIVDCNSDPWAEVPARLVFNYLLFIAPIQLFAWFWRRTRKKKEAAGQGQEGEINQLPTADKQDATI